MKNVYMKMLYLGTVGLIAALVTVTGCKSSGERTSGQVKSDKEVTKSVKSALEADPTFKYTDVHANTYNGAIQLTGFVETPEQRLRAAEMASDVKGARQVINNIMIKPTATGRATIRDPLGHETGRVLIDTNSPPHHMRNLEDTTEQNENNPK